MVKEPKRSDALLRVIAPQGSKNAGINIFMNFTLEQLCKDPSDHQNSLTIFDQHSMHYWTM